ncbi:Cell death protease, partial [Coemansia helicoidea]
DFLCNYIGIEWMVGNLTWAGARGLGAPGAAWTIDGREVGRVAAARGLTYALIHSASHMVGVDKPREMLDVFTAFSNASAANLRFRSSLRTGGLPPAPPPPPQTSAGAVGKWVALGAALLLAALFLAFFLCRRRLHAWWVARSHRYDSVGSAHPPPGGDLAVHTGGRGLDDAFVLHEFTKRRSRDSLDVAGLLLDDDPASSPDDALPAVRRPWSPQQQI